MLTLRIALVVFVLAWILGPDELRSAVPIWIVFLIALGLEVHFFAGALRAGATPAPDRRPQEIDRERYGWREEEDEFLEEEDEVELEPWAPTGHAQSPALWPALRRFLVGVAVVVALALTIWVVEGQTGWDAVDGDRRAEAVARFSAEASRIAEKRVSIRCDESRDYVGVVQHADGVATVGGDQAYVTPEICLALYRLAFDGEVRASRTARAIAVLAHEAWHLRGERDEGRTECYALQSGVDLGMRLGLSEERARQLMRQQLVENQLRTGASFEYLVPADCREGGPLDLRPEESGFP